MEHGLCKMCHKEKDLQKSHLIPKSVHEYCSEGGYKPIGMFGEIVMAGARQLKHPLLCFECEQILSAGGEEWMADKLATYDKQFPFYDLVIQGHLADTTSGSKIYFVRDVAAIKIKDLVHFALGIFFRASVHSWRGDSTEPRIDLGPYGEAIRTWLRGESAFPEHCYLVVHVATPERAHVGLFPPYLAEKKSWCVYYTYVSGVLFMLNVGKSTGFGPKNLCIWNNPDRPILVSGVLLDKFEAMVKEKLQSSKHTQSFLAEMEEVAKKKQTMS